MILRPIPKDRSSLTREEKSQDAAENSARHFEDGAGQALFAPFSGSAYLEVGTEFLAAGGTGHQHSTDIFRETQFLAAIGTIHFSIHRTTLYPFKLNITSMLIS